MAVRDGIDRAATTQVLSPMSFAIVVRWISELPSQMRMTQALFNG